MYAAAGGASLASRQARLKKKKQNKNDRLQQIKNQNIGDLRQNKNRQFQNYTEPKIQLSRVERNALRPPPLQAESRRHSTSHLKEPSRARIKESPSVLIPIQNHLNQSQQQHHQHHQHHPFTPHHTLVQEHAPLHPSSSIQSQLPQILIPEGENKLERRCSFVRQVEEMEKCHEGDVLDRCNHICNFEIKDDKPWDSNLTYYSEFHRSAFGSLDYPFSEIHDSSYGGESEEDIFAVYHQSAAANALLYVGLGTTAIGSVVFFVGSGDKGFKTLELRLIGPTLVACGLLCCLIRILLCACPSTCIRRRKKTRLKNVCPHSTSTKFPMQQTSSDFVAVDPTTSLISKQKKRVSIAQNKPIPSTSTAEEFCPHKGFREKETNANQIPIIAVPEYADFNAEEAARFSEKEEASIELQNFELAYELESVSSNDSDSIVVIETETSKLQTKLTRTRVPVHSNNAKEAIEERDRIDEEDDDEDRETCLSIVIERNNSENSVERNDKTSKNDRECEKLSHSGILLSPLQLEQ